MTYQINITTSKPTEQQARIFELDKTATALKKKGDMEGAIKCLAESFEIRKQHGGTEPEGWTKYPLYLQQAGHFDEAVRTFSWLIENAEEITQMAPDMADQPPFVMQWQTQMFLAKVHDKARLSCQRQSQTEGAASHDEQRATCLDKVERLGKIVALHRERERGKRQQRLQQLKIGTLSFEQFASQAKDNR